MRKRKRIPKFKTEEAELRFWGKHDSTDYVDYTTSVPVSFENLRPSTRTISLRLPESVLSRLKTLAHKRDVPYQTLLKIFLAERLDQELRNEQSRASYVAEPRSRRR